MKKLYPAVKAIIKRGDKFLVIKQKFNGQSAWDIPGGRVEFGENPYDTLVREVMEEVHLSVEIVKPIGMFWFFRYDGEQVICNTFLCKIKKCNVDITKSPADENIVKYKWVTKKEFLNKKYKVGHESLLELIRNI